MTHDRFVNTTRSLETGPATARHPATSSICGKFESPRNRCSRSVKSPSTESFLYVNLNKGCVFPTSNNDDASIPDASSTRNSSNREFVPPRSPHNTALTPANTDADRFGRYGKHVSVTSRGTHTHSGCVDHTSHAPRSDCSCVSYHRPGRRSLPSQLPELEFFFFASSRNFNKLQH